MKNSLSKNSNTDSMIGTTTSHEAFILNLIIANEITSFRNQRLYLKNLNFLEYFPDYDIDTKISPLQLASYLGKIEIAKCMLMNQFIDTDLASEETGHTPLMLACISGNFEIAELLICNGAEVNKPNKYNVTPLSCVFARLGDTDNYSYENGKICYKLANLLLDYGADINWIVDKKKGFTLLHQLVSVKLNLSEKESLINLEMIRFLIEHGADKTLTTLKGKSSFDLCNKNCNFTEVKNVLMNTQENYYHDVEFNKAELEDRLNSCNKSASIISGSISGIVIEAIYFPIDSIKTRIQASSDRIDFQKKAKDVSKYKGIVSVLLAGAPYTALFFGTYESSKRILSKISLPILKENLQNGWLNHLIAASIAEIVANGVRTPFEVIKQQMQVGWNKTFLQTSNEIYLARGLKGFYAGYSSVILREIPFSSIQFPLYEFLKARTLANKGEFKMVDSSINGFIAGSTAAFFTTPIDVIKTKLMTQRDGYYIGVIDCFKKICKDEGYKGLMKAYHIRSLTLGFTGNIFFTMYEGIRGVLLSKFKH